MQRVTDALGTLFPTWRLVRPPAANSLPSAPRDTQIIAPTERPPWPTLILLGAQHVLSMFGATVFAPLLMGFPTSTALFFSGIATLIFFFIVGGRVPSYLGSSFAFIGPVLAVTGFSFNPADPLAVNPKIEEALGGILICGVVYLVIAGVVIVVRSSEWITFVMPPTVTGAVVMGSYRSTKKGLVNVRGLTAFPLPIHRSPIHSLTFHRSPRSQAIGLNLAPAAIGQATASGFDAWIAFGVVLITTLCASWGFGVIKRLPILVGGVLGWIIYLVCGVCGVGLVLSSLLPLLLS